MRIKDGSLQQVLQTADVADVIGDYLTLKRRGRNLIARCPFHDEKTPSFNVTPEKNIYKCFGCGKAGDSVNFLMELEGLTFTQAIENLAKKYNITLEYDKSSSPEENLEAAERESILAVLQFAARHFQQNLAKSQEGKSIALPYLKERGILPTTAEAYMVGWALDNRTDLLDSAEKAGYKVEFLEKAGLIIKREDGQIIDKYRGRLIFPIFSQTGKILGFGGRTLKKDEKTPKYINSPETLVYNKSQVLYGLYQARGTIRKEGFAYLVEGYMDVAQMHQAGVGHVVAVSGTSLTKEQCKLIARQTDSITVVFDGDTAGQKAAFRGIDMLLEEALQVRVLNLPENNDPDSYIRKYGSQAFIDYSQQYTQDFVSFKAQALAKEAGADPFKRSAMVQEIVATISLIPDPITRQVFLKECALLVGIDEATLASEARRLEISRKQKESKRQANTERKTRDAGTPPPGEDYQPYPPPPIDFDNESGLGDLLEKPFSPLEQLEALEKQTLWIILQWGQLEVEEGIALPRYLYEETTEVRFQTPLYARCWQILKNRITQGVIPTPADLLQNENTEIRNLAAELLANQPEISPGWKENGMEVMPEGQEVMHQAYLHVMRLKHGVVKNQLNEMQKRIAESDSEEEQQSMLAQYLQFKSIEQALGKELGRVVTSG